MNARERTAPCPTQYPVAELRTCALLLSSTWTGDPGKAARAQLSQQQHPAQLRSFCQTYALGAWDGICRFLQAGEHLQLTCRTVECCHAGDHQSILPKDSNQLPLLITLQLLARS